jgi:hypothetical protein
LSKDSELSLMTKRYNLDVTDTSVYDTVKSICEIASHTREQFRQEDGRITNFVSTRAVCEMVELVKDGFNLREISEAAIYPEFSNDGGIESERTYVKQVVQKYIPAEASSDPLMNDPFVSNRSQPPF